MRISKRTTTRISKRTTRNQQTNDDENQQTNDDDNQQTNDDEDNGMKNDDVPAENTRTQRHKKQKRFSENWLTFTRSGRRSGHCVCNKPWKTVDNGQMAECEICRKWYHMSCLNVKLPSFLTTIPNFNIDNLDLTFICGLNNCNNGNQLFRINKYMYESDGYAVELIENVKLSKTMTSSRQYMVESTDMHNMVTCSTQWMAEDTVEMMPSERNVASREETETESVSQSTSRMKMIDATTQCVYDEMKLMGLATIHEPKTLNELVENSTIAMVDSSTQWMTEDTVDMMPSERNVASREETESVSQADRTKIAEVLDVNIDSETFSYPLPRAATFNFSTENWNILKQSQTGRCFKKGMWQHYFVAGLKESNKFCSFIFKNHVVSKKRVNFKSDTRPLFHATARCTFSGCSVSVSLQMFSVNCVDVQYKGVLCHKKNELRSRPIRIGERLNLQKELSTGVKPLNKYLQFVKSMDNELLFSGNCDGFGKDSHVLAQIACEGRQHREDKDYIYSVMKQMDTMKSDSKIGFIQKFCIRPNYVLYWSYEGLSLFHKFAAQNILYWDATGSMVKPCNGNKKFLYYELAMENPENGKMAIPLSGMISDDQSLKTLLDWMTSFRDAEKKHFGYKNLVQPKLIVSDQAWVFILCGLKIFNNENFNQYLERMWAAVNSESQSSTKKYTTIHLCSSHIMNKFSKFLRENCKSQFKSAMYMLSLLLNCRSLREAEIVWHDICVALMIPNLNEKHKMCVEGLIKNINSFNVDDSQYEKVEIDSGTCTVDDVDVPSDRLTEEQILNLASSSPFRTWGECIQSRVLQYQKKGETIKNVYLNEKLGNEILHRYIAILPLWTAISCKELSAFGVGSDGLHIARTSGCIENRFRILKNICLKGRSRMRLDDFSMELRDHSVSVQRLAMRNCLKVRQMSKPRRKKFKIIKETWNKTFIEPEQLKKKSGKFQKPPKLKFESLTLKSYKANVPPTNVPLASTNKTSNENQHFDHTYHVKPYDVDHENQATKVNETKDRQQLNRQMTITTSPSLLKYCKMTNINFKTCWLNSFIQGICASNFAILIILKSCNSTSCIEIDMDPLLDAKLAIADVVKYIDNKRDSAAVVPDSLLHNMLHKICAAAVCENGDPILFPDRQNDIDEFNRVVITKYSEDFSNTLLIEQVYTCTKSSCCFATTVQDQCDFTLYIDVVHEGSYSLSFLLNETFKDRILEDSKCQQCGNSCNRHEDIISFPVTLFICIKRYGYNVAKRTTSKNHAKIAPDQILHLDKYSSLAKPVSYVLRAAICHYGDRCTEGHYTTFVLQEDAETFVKCDDHHITVGDAEEMKKTVYYVIYDKILQELPDFAPSIIDSFQQSCGTKHALNICRELKHDVFLERRLKDILCLTNDRNVRDFKLYNTMNESDNHILSNISEIEAMKFTTLFLDYIFQKQKHNIQIGHDSYFITVHSVIKCSCGFQTVRAQHLPFLLVGTCNDMDIAISNEFLTMLPHEQTCINCSCKVMPSISLSSLPETVIIAVLQPALYNRDNIPLHLDVSKWNIVNQELHWKAFTLSATVQLNQYNTILLYNLMASTVPVLKTLSQYSTCDMAELCINQTIDETSLRCKMQQLRFEETGRYKVLKYILNETNWLRTSDIDTYLMLLCKSIPHDIYAFSASFFGSELLYASNPDYSRNSISSTYNFQQKSLFARQFIIIPVNIRNVHWVVFVIDVVNKQILYCDSTGDMNLKLIHQVWYFLTTYHLHEKGTSLNLSDWNIVDYCNAVDFPIQSDTSSCGAYVCVVSKAIVLRRRLQARSKTISKDLRQYIVMDFINWVSDSCQQYYLKTSET